jgi:SAM-dependent MidA family methyltransferase
MTASTPRSILPALTAVESEHSARLEALIRQQLLAAGGWLSFERFMELALYAPGLGYYSAGSAKIGPGGDFVTAPEVSDLFGRCLARQCAQVLAVTGGEVLELGAGTGRLAAQILRELEASGSLPARYAILEVSADLAARQRAHLAQLPATLRERVVWLERLPQVPISGVILANEVADALPCRRFVTRGAEIREVGIALAAGPTQMRAFALEAAAPDPALAGAWAALRAALPEPLPEGYTSEICLRVGPWIATLADVLARGLLLICDYGLPRRHYYHPQRVTGTLTCHYKQRAHTDPLINIGVQDITAWVDFTRIAEAGVGAGLALSGFATQAGVLIALGIEELVGAAGDDAGRARLAGEARRLLMPEEMGEAFKMMALTRGLDAPLAGFALQDLSPQL